MTGRFRLIPLVIASVLSLLRCTTQVVNTRTTALRADTTDQTTKIDLVSEPTLDRPVAEFRAYRFTEVKDTRVRTTWIKHRPARAAWVGAVGSILAGGAVGGLLFTSGRVVLGRNIASVGAVPFVAAALASLVTTRRNTALIDTSRTMEPLPAIVKLGNTQVAAFPPGGHGTAVFELKDYVGSLPVVTNDTALTICVTGTPGSSRSFALTRATYESAVRIHRAVLEQQARADSIELERKTAEERARRIAEERRGTLIGMFPTAQSIPSRCQTARVVDEGTIGTSDRVFANDIWGTFPELADKGRTELERESFLATAAGDSYRSLLRAKRTELTRGMLVLHASSARIFDYEVERSAFPVRLGEVTGLAGYGMQEAENEYGRGVAAHVVEGVWFDGLPLRAVTLLGMAVNQYLDIKVTSRARALDIERRRDSLQVWIAFRLTGGLRQLSRPSLPIFKDDVKKFPETTDPVIMLVDIGKGDVVWSSR